jgi:hypothetical protein
MTTTDLDLLPPLRRYFEKLESLAANAGDSKLDALIPFMRSHALATADDLGWTAQVFREQEAEPVSFSVHFGSLGTPQVEATRRPARSNLHEVVAAALRGSVLKGTLNALYMPVGAAGQSAFRLELSSGEDARLAIAAIISRVHRASFALTLSSAFDLVDAYASTELQQRLVHAALETIDRTCGGESSIARPHDLDHAAKDIANEVSKSAADLRKALGEHPRYEQEARRANDTGDMLWLDATLANTLQATGDHGKLLAERVRKKSRDRWSSGEDLALLWAAPDNPFGAKWVEYLAEALWIDRVRANLERAAHRSPAIVRATLVDRVIPSMTRQAVFPEFDDGAIVDARGSTIGRIALTTGATLEAVRHGADALGKVPGHRLIRALVHRSHEAWNRGNHDPRRVSFEGGWTGLLDALRVSRKELTLVKDIAQAGQCIVWNTNHTKNGGLWTWSERKGSKAAPGEVSFVLGDVLTPGYGKELSRVGGNGLAARIARRLVPELRFDPPMGGARERDHGGIWTLHRLMLVELVDKAEQLHADGAALITPQEWQELARKARVSPNIILRTLDGWVAGESENAPPLLDRVATDAWTLASSHAPEREFIAAGGARRAHGRSSAQKAGKTKRRARS